MKLNKWKYVSETNTTILGQLCFCHCSLNLFFVEAQYIDICSMKFSDFTTENLRKESKSSFQLLVEIKNFFLFFLESNSKIELDLLFSRYFVESNRCIFAHMSSNLRNLA